MSILATDLGKSKSVARHYEDGQRAHHYTTIRTTPQDMHDPILEHGPNRLDTPQAHMEDSASVQVRTRRAV